MADVKRVVDIDIAISIFFKLIEDMGLERISRLHDERVQVEPPKPKN